mgnify:CR=1 FL=1
MRAHQLTHLGAYPPEFLGHGDATVILTKNHLRNMWLAGVRPGTEEAEEPPFTWTTWPHGAHRLIGGRKNFKENHEKKDAAEKMKTPVGRENEK